LRKHISGKAACAIAAILWFSIPSIAAIPQKATSLAEFSSSIEDLSEQVSKSVVQIVVTGYGFDNSDNLSGSNQLVRQRATGSGVIVSRDGLIMTNAHVVDGARHISVHLNSMAPQPMVLDGEVLGLDRLLDLALVRVHTTGVEPLEFADSDLLKQGEVVLAFGAPLGLENSVSMGVISSVARQITSDDPRVYIQTDAPINPGNSGGPLVDTSGKIAGINTFIFSQSGGSQGLGFAIPSNVVAYALNQFKTDGHVHRGQIGVALRTITDPLAEGLGLSAYSGALIEDMNPHGPAAEAGLEIGDVIMAIGGRRVQSTRDFSLGLYRFAIGDQADLKVLRDNKLISVKVRIVEPADDPERLADLVDPDKNAVPSLGILAMNITEAVKKILGDLRMDTGVLVAASAGASAYVGDALELGDVIHGVNGHPIDDLGDLRTVLDQQKPGSSLILQIEREQHLQYLVLESN